MKKEKVLELLKIFETSVVATYEIVEQSDATHFDIVRLFDGLKEDLNCLLKDGES